MRTRSRLGALVGAAALVFLLAGIGAAHGNDGYCDDDLKVTLTANQDWDNCPDVSEAPASEPAESEPVSEPPASFEQSFAPETDAPSEPPASEPAESEPVSEPPASEPAESEPVSEPPPSFVQSQEGLTDAPSEPNTATIGGNRTSAPADGAWLLVVALGVLLASIVVLTPAPARRRK